MSSSKRSHLPNRPNSPRKKQKISENKSQKKYINREEYIHLEITDQYISSKQAKDIVSKHIEDQLIDICGAEVGKNSAPSWNAVNNLTYKETSGKSDGVRKELKKFKQCKVCNKVIKIGKAIKAGVDAHMNATKDDQHNKDVKDLIKKGQDIKDSFLNKNICFLDEK